MAYQKGHIAENAIPITYKRLVDKFFASIDETKSIQDCWNWKGPCHKNGYSRLAIGKTDGPNFFFEAGHRFAYRMYNGGAIPKNMVVAHRCDNKKCVNPMHLFLGTQLENMQDKIEKGRDARGPKHALATKLGMLKKERYGQI